MFYKRVLGSGLVAMALSLGAQAMQKGGIGQGYSQDEQSEEYSTEEEDEYDVALPSKGASQDKKSVQVSAPVIVQSSKAPACQGQVVESSKQSVEACEQSPAQTCQQAQFDSCQQDSAQTCQQAQFDSCQQDSSQTCQQDQFDARQQNSACQDSLQGSIQISQASTACQDQAGLNDKSWSCSEQTRCGALVTAQTYSACDTKLDLCGLIHDDKFCEINSNGFRFHANHNLHWKKIKGKSWKHDYLTNFNMHKVKFKKTLIHDIYLQGRFDKVHFGKKTIIDQSTFSGDFLGVTFDGATITNTRFENARFAHGGHLHLINSSFAGAKLQNVRFENVVFNEHVSFRGAIFGENVSFAGVQVETNSCGLITMTERMSARFIADIHNGASASMSVAQWIVSQGFNVADGIHGAAYGAMHSITDSHHHHGRNHHDASDSDSDSTSDSDSDSKSKSNSKKACH